MAKWGGHHHERAVRVADCTERARTLAATDRYTEALALQEEALGIARGIAVEHPDDRAGSQAIASILYAMGSSLTAIGRPDVAVAVLDESARIYQDLGRRGVAVRAPLADVHACKGSAELARGHGATAVLELDTAVSAYIDLHTDADDPRLLDLARVLALNALALRGYGDPDVAVASADAATRFYLSRPDALVGAPDAVAHNRYLLLAAGAAADLHAVYGRLDVALGADDAAVRAAVAVADVTGSGPANRDLAFALTRKGLHLRAVGRRTEGESFVDHGRAADPTVAALAIAEWERVSAGVAPVTLAQALDTAGRVPGAGRLSHVLAETLVRPAASLEILAPSTRCSPRASPGYAAMLADLAVQLLPTAPAAGVRIGLEAHYLFAVSSREQTMPMRHSYREFGFRWALVLLACSRHYVDANESSMALDLAGWADAAAMGLVPFLAGAPGLAALVRECLAHHADLYVRNGDVEAGAEVLRVVRSLDEYGVP